MKELCKAHSPSDWNKPRFATRSLAKCHGFSFALVDVPSINGARKRGQSLLQADWKVWIDVEAVDDINESYTVVAN